VYVGPARHRRGAGRKFGSTRPVLFDVRLDAWSRERRNNFDVLRLFAAAIVLVSHSFVVAGHYEPHVGHFPLGTLGVEIFFAISGFLVAKSWFAEPRLRAFVVKRGLRIMPALVVAVLALAFVLGPVVTGDSPASYFGARATYSYPVDSIVAVPTGGTARDVGLYLPGVFTGNPTSSVDLSLWTLPIEVQAYIALSILGMVGLLSGLLPVVAAGFLALSLVPGAADIPVIGSALQFVRGADGEAAHLLAIFFVAALMYRHRARIALRGGVAAVMAVAAVATLGTGLERPVLVVAIPYLALFFAYRTWGGLRTLTARGDVSYGLYLLAFPVQQTIVQVSGDPRPSPGVVALIALPITYALAFASWHMIEKHALRLKGRLVAPHATPVAVPPDREPAPAAVHA
jgi:peptidoglycan/LPS O-acetylase OafA/YrhL